MSYPLYNADLLEICERRGTATSVLGLVKRGDVQAEVGLLG